MKIIKMGTIIMNPEGGRTISGFEIDCEGGSVSLMTLVDEITQLSKIIVSTKPFNTSDEV